MKEKQIQKEKQMDTFPDIDCSCDDFLTSELKNDERHGKKDENLSKKIFFLLIDRARVKEKTYTCVSV